MLSAFTSTTELSKKEQTLVETLLEKGFTYKEVKKISELEPDAVAEHLKFLKKVSKQIEKIQAKTKAKRTTTKAKTATKTIQAN